MTNGVRKRIFLSYAHEDAAAARRLREDLDSLGVDVWFDEKSLLPGQNWRREIRNAIRSSDFFILILSRYSVTKRGVVQRELKDALDVMGEMPEGGVFIIPARIEPVAPSHDLLKDIQWVDLFDDWAEGIRLIGLTLFRKDEPTSQHTEPVDLRHLVKSVTATSTERDPDVRIEFLDKLEESAAITANPNLVRVIFEEILSNALYHTATDPDGQRRVVLELRSTRDSVILEIKNQFKKEMVKSEITIPEAGQGPVCGLWLARNAAIRYGGDLKFSIRDASNDSEAVEFVASLSFPKSTGVHSAPRSENYTKGFSNERPVHSELSFLRRGLKYLRANVVIVLIFLLPVLTGFTIFLWTQGSARSNFSEVDFNLYPNLVRGDGERSTIPLTAGTRTVRLHLSLLSDKYQSYQADLFTEDGNLLLAEGDLHASVRDGRGAIIIKLESQGLPSGDYSVQLSGIANNGEKLKIATYYFRVMTK